MSKPICSECGADVELADYEEDGSEMTCSNKECKCYIGFDWK